LHSFKRLGSSQSERINFEILRENAILAKWVPKSIVDWMPG